MLPQVLAGLGASGLVSTGLLIWIERLRPVLVALAAVSLGYSAYLYFRPGKRKFSHHLIFWASAAANVAALLFWLRLQGRLF